MTLYQPGSFTLLQVNPLFMHRVSGFQMEKVTTYKIQNVHPHRNDGAHLQKVTKCLKPKVMTANGIKDKEGVYYLEDCGISNLKYLFGQFLKGGGGALLIYAQNA